jgi:hypothetical protein
VEYANTDPHLTGHPRSWTIYHWIGIYGYQNYGNLTMYADSIHGTNFQSWDGAVPAYTTNYSSSDMTTLLNQRGLCGEHPPGSRSRVVPATTRRLARRAAGRRGSRGSASWLCLQQQWAHGACDADCVPARADGYRFLSLLLPATHASAGMGPPDHTPSALGIAR